MSDGEILSEVSLADFTGKLVHQDAQLRLEMIGTADARAVPALESFVPKVHYEATRLKSSVVVVDMTELEFMNSSCFKQFLNWLTWIRALETEQRYRVRFVTSRALHWQQASLKALACFAVGVVEIELGDKT